jgi:hypothetical protein
MRYESGPWGYRRAGFAFFTAEDAENAAAVAEFIEASKAVPEFIEGQSI